MPDLIFTIGHFRGYADHIATHEFADALDELLGLAAGRQGAVPLMCAEAKWSQCHPQLVAGALVARGLKIRHILSTGEALRHELTLFARVTGRTVRDPAFL